PIHVRARTDAAERVLRQPGSIAARRQFTSSVRPGSQTRCGSSPQPCQLPRGGYRCCDAAKSLESTSFRLPGRMENLVEIKDVSFAYGFRPVLKGINMAVPRGKVVSIMGLSGCGKTTLLRLIAGAIKPRKGEVRVGGRVINRMKREELYAERRKMGMLYQFGALFTDMTALENVAFQIREHTNLPEDMVQDLAMMKLNAVGLRGAHHMMPAELSGGMARRVALARAIALDPTLIMYDEPFTGLDPISLGVISNLLRRLNDV